MKTCLASLLMLITTATVHASGSTDICSYMPCGTYVQAAHKTDPKSVETKIAIASTGADTGTYDYTITSQDGKSSTWPLTVKFDGEGYAVLRWKGEDIYATAICAYQLCNYALVPFKNDEGKIWGNAGLMRFTGDTLEFEMTVGSPTDFRSNSMVLKKQ